LHRNGVAMDPDLNKYDSEHACTAHPLMSEEEWKEAYRQAWLTYYDSQHVETLIRRARASRLPTARMAELILRFYGSWLIEGVHPLQAVQSRRKYRRDRRPGLPRESPFVFYPRYAWEIISKQRRWRQLGREYDAIRQRVEAEPANYTDLALTPVTDHEVEEL